MQFPADSAPVSIPGSQMQDSQPCRNEQLSNLHLPPLLEQHGGQLPSPRPGRGVSIFTMGRTTGHPTPGRNIVWGQESWVPPLGQGKSFAVSQQPGPSLITSHCTQATSTARPESSTAQQCLKPCPQRAPALKQSSHTLRWTQIPRFLLKLQILTQQTWGGA